MPKELMMRNVLLFCCSSSLRRKSREQRLSNGGRIHEQTSISPKGIRQKDSSSSDDSSDDHDRFSAKTHNISRMYTWILAVVIGISNK